MKKIFMFVVVCALMFQLAACSTKESSNTAGGSGAPNTESAGKGGSEKVNLRYSWWGSEDRHTAILAAIDAYEKLNPNVKIEAEYSAFASYYQKLLTELAGGTAPDIISVDYKWVQDLITKGKPFVDMNTMQDKIDMSGLDMKFAAEQAGNGDYLLGLPLAVNAMGMVYNKDLLAAAGIEMNDDWDWDMVMEAGTKLHQSDSSKYLMILSTNQYIYLMKTQLKQKTGNNIILDDYKLGFDRQQLVDVFAYFRSMLDKGVLPPFEEAVQYGEVYAEQIPGWLNGNYAISLTSASKVPPIEAASKFEVGVARFPIFQDPVNPGVIVTPAMIIGISKESKQIDEAAKFIDWFINDREANLLVKDTIGLPAVESAATLLTEEKLVNANIASMVKTALPFAGTPENGLSIDTEIDKILKRYVEQLGFAKLTPEEAADGLIKDVNGKLAELQAK